MLAGPIPSIPPHDQIWALVQVAESANPPRGLGYMYLFQVT